MILEYDIAYLPRTKKLLAPREYLQLVPFHIHL